MFLYSKRIDYIRLFRRMSRFILLFQVNKLDTVTVKAVIYPYDPAALEQPSIPRPWKKTKIPVGTILDNQA